jgi:hypothetical protein
MSSLSLLNYPGVRVQIQKKPKVCKRLTTTTKSKHNPFVQFSTQFKLRTNAPQGSVCHDHTPQMNMDKRRACSGCKARICEMCVALDTYVCIICANLECNQTAGGHFFVQCQGRQHPGPNYFPKVIPQGESYFTCPEHPGMRELCSNCKCEGHYVCGIHGRVEGSRKCVKGDFCLLNFSVHVPCTATLVETKVSYSEQRFNQLSAREVYIVALSRDVSCEAAE